MGIKSKLDILLIKNWEVFSVLTRKSEADSSRLINNLTPGFSGTQRLASSNLMQEPSFGKYKIEDIKILKPKRNNH